MNKWVVLLLGGCGAILAGCDWNNKKEGSSSQPVLELMISGEEGLDSVSILLQVHSEDEGEGGIRLEKGISAFVEDHELSLDSAGVSGYYYRGKIAFPADSLLQFKVEKGGKRLTSQVHEVQRPVLDVPSEFTRAGLTIPGSEQRARFRVAIVDTAYLSNDLSGIYVSSAEGLKIPETDLALLAPGPVFLTITWEKRKRLDNGPFSGEIISKYSIFRESFLQ